METQPQGIEELEFIKGHWTAAGHCFNPKMVCVGCNRTFEQHQSEPTYCTSPRTRKKYRHKTNVRWVNGKR